MSIHLAVNLSLPRDARYVPVVRKLLSGLLEGLRVDDETRHEIELPLTEACANVVEHADQGDEFVVAVEIDTEGCLIEITDQGTGGTGGGGPPARFDDEGGRGLSIMRALVDDLQFLRGPSGHTVRLRKSWPRPVDEDSLLSADADEA